MQVGSIGGSIDSILKPFYEDTVLAWVAVKLFERAQVSGDFRYFEYFIASAGKAYTLDTLMVLRKGAFDTRTIFSWSMDIADAAPFMVGENGLGHFSRGHRIAGRIPGDLTRRIHVERVAKTTLSWGRDRSAGWGLIVGENKPQEDPLVRLMGDAAALKSELKEAGVF